MYHRAVARAGRFTTIAPLPPHGEWRRALALDRGAGTPRPVVLSFVPSSVLDAPERLAALSRDVEAAGRLHHPSAMPVLGTETVGDALAIVEEWRPGATVRALLDAGGRLPADLAARIAADVCGALARAHATDAGDGRRLAHGALSADHVLVGEDGIARLCGFGEAAGGDPPGDLRALASVLHECLAGEPPGPAAARLDAPGVPPALAAAVDRALGAAPGGPYGSAAALTEAIAATPLASQPDVAAYAEAIVPAEEGGRGALRRAVAQAAGAEPSEEVSEDYIVEPTDPLVQPPPRDLPRPPQTRPGVDPAGVFHAPAAPPPRSPVPIVLAVAALCAVAGFAIGFAWSLARVPPPPPVSLELPAPDPGAPPAAAQAAAPAGAVATSAATKPPAPARGKAPPHAAKAPAKPAKLAQKAAAPAGKGKLSVSAPDDAEVFLDGKKIGRGSLEVEIAAGAHRLEVRRGDAKVGEKFSVEPNETWTYDVTPTATSTPAP